ncbi:hypothetical protein [Streptomyces mirabilis]|uniref:hypothetical protein n=1 Tax=Streptomyces mirabilis TaxID=68239 RepID=UPI0033E864C7
MTIHALSAFPAFRLGPATGAAHDVLGPDDQVVGQVATGSPTRGRAGVDLGPVRQDVQRAAEDAVMLHIAAHGLPDSTPEPYSGAGEARVAVGLPLLQETELIDSAARAFHFRYLRQEHVAAILDGMETLRRERDGVGARAGCRRLARLLHLVRDPARALLSEITGDAREWLVFPLARLLTFTEQAIARLEATAERPPADLIGRFPDRHAADQLLDTLHRAYREVQAEASTLPRPRALPEALRALEAVVQKLPNGPCASTAEACRTTAAALDAVADAARMVTAAAAELPTPGTAARESEELATEGRVRLHFTACVLDDAGRLGTVRAITDTLNDAELGPEHSDGTRSIRVGGQEIGPIRRTGDGWWGGPGIDEPLHSPEGAAAVLVHAHRARQKAARER